MKIKIEKKISSEMEMLITEREQIEIFLTPPPLDEEKERWKKEAISRKKEIDKILIPLFFDSQQEGTKRNQAYGFTAILKCEISRTLDVAALSDVMEKCDLIRNGIEDELINWKPTLHLKTYRELPAKLKFVFDHALIVKPAEPKFEIVRNLS